MTLKTFFLIDQLGGGGAEKSFKIVSEELARRDPDAITLVIVENRKAYDLAPHLHTVTLVESLNARTAPLALKRYVSLLRRERPALQISTNSKGQLFSFAARLFTGTPTVATTQVDLVAHYHDRPRLLKSLLWSMRAADGYSFISRGIYENLKEHLPERPRFFVPNPIDLEEIDGLKEEPLPEEYASIFAKPVVIHVGRLTEQKSQHTLLEAFAQVEHDGNLVILGSGDREAELKQLVAQRGISDRVFFLGFQRNPFRFLRQADLFVLSSAWEGFGNVIVEAMACGLPILSVDCPSGPREILAPETPPLPNTATSIEQTSNGVLSPLGDANLLAQAMNRLMADPELRQHYSQRSLIRAADYSREKVASAYHDMIVQMTQETKA